MSFGDGSSPYCSSARLFLLAVALLSCCPGWGHGQSVRKQIAISADVGPIATSADYIFVGTSAGLQVFNISFTTGASPVHTQNVGEVTTVSLQGNTVFFCFRNMGTSNARCLLHASSPPFAMQATSGNLMSLPAPVFTSSLNYSVLCKSVALGTTSAFYFGVPTSALGSGDGRARTLVRFAISGTSLSMTKSVVVFANSTQPEVTGFAVMYIFAERLYTIMNRRSGSTTISYLASVCTQDTMSTGIRYAELLDTYGSYSEAAMPQRTNAGNYGDFGNSIVSSSRTSGMVYYLWTASPSWPASVMSIQESQSISEIYTRCITAVPSIAVQTTLAGFLPPIAAVCTGQPFGDISLSLVSIRCVPPLLAASILPVTGRLSSGFGNLIFSTQTVPLRSRYSVDFVSMALFDADVVTTGVPSSRRTFLMLGTSTGQIVKAIQVPLGSEFLTYEVRTIDSTLRRPIRSLTEVGGQLQASAVSTSASEVIHFAGLDCGGFQDCQQCVSHSSDLVVSFTVHPYCRWDINQARCVQLDLTTSGLLSNSSQCPFVTEIVPASVPIRLSRMITIRARLALSMGAVVCRFMGLGQPYMSSATVATGADSITNYMCATPAIAAGANASSTFTRVELFSSNINAVVVTSEASLLNLFDCNQVQRCGACTADPFDCSWCPFDSICRLPGDACRSQSKTCSALASVTPPAAGVHADITLQLTGTNLPAPGAGDTYQCLISKPDFSLNQTTNAAVTGQTVNCGTLRIMSGFVSPTTGQTRLFVSPVLNGYVITDLASTVQLTAYNCPQSGVAGCSACVGDIIFTQCRWCDAAMSCIGSTDPTACSMGTSTQTCGIPVITSISPGVGPVNGGTSVLIEGNNFGFSVASIESITFGGQSCTDLRNFSVGNQVRCTTPNIVGLQSELPYQVQITTRTATGNVMVGSGGSFQFQPVSVSRIFPLRGPIGGGTMIDIIGAFLDIGNVSVAVEGDGFNATCTIMNRNASFIECTTANVSTSGAPTNIVVRLDAFAHIVPFEYVPDPTVQDGDLTMSIVAGGLPIRFPGTNLDAVRDPMAIFTFTNMALRTLTVPCTATAAVLTCPTAAVDSPGITAVVSLRLGIIFKANVATISYSPNPTIDVEAQTVVSGVDQTLTITGTNLTSSGLTRNSYQVEIGIGGSCDVIALSEDTITCSPPKVRPTMGGDVNGTFIMRVRVGNFVASAGQVTYSRVFPTSDNSGAIIGGAVGGVVLLLLIIFIVVYCSFRGREKKHSRQMGLLMQQMDTIEATVASECKSAFAELQTNLGDLGITADSSFEALPFWSFDEYASKLLFPAGGGNQHSLMPLASKLSSMPDKDLTLLRSVLQRFEQRLLRDKKFLVPFIHTLESQSKFHMVDRVFVASLLMVAFQDNLYYATEILKLLLTDLIKKSSGKHPKLLLRRTESVAEKLLTNWLCFCLHDYIRAEVGTPLFMLFHAMKTHIESGPVDAVTGEARNSLSEERLLRDKVDYSMLMCYAIPDLHRPEQRYTVRLLTCDTISQAKEKVLDAMYRTSPVSMRPAFETVDLSLVSPNGTSCVPLRDMDQSSAYAGELTKINTIGFYKVKEGSTFCVTSRGEGTLMRVKDQTSVLFPKQSGATQRLISEDGNKLWHLVVPVETGEHQANGGRASTKLVSEIYLTRLLSAKKTLQPYVDGLFRVVFCSENGKVPAAIKYLFDYIDQQAAEMNLSDPDIVQTWKNNSVPLRFWINIIKNPEFVLDIHKTATLDNCLSVVAQAFMDSCSVSDMRLSKDSPSTKLLYAKEVKENYRSKIQSYYSEIQAMTTISEEEMQEMMRTASQTHVQSNILSKESAVFELYKYAAMYADDISDTLEEDNRPGLVKIFEGCLNDAPPLDHPSTHTQLSHVV